MSTNGIAEKRRLKSVLDPVDRASEMLFGLFMALTFVGAVSVAPAGREGIHTMFAAALGCNLGWGLVDGVMYLVDTLTARGHSLALVRSVRAAADIGTGRRLIESSLPPAIAGMVSITEIEAIREHLVALAPVPERPSLERGDLLAAVAICLIVVATTFPVVLPFALIGDVGTAKAVSRAVGLAMLFCGGLFLGSYAGYGTWKTGLFMVALGTCLVGAIIALGG